MHVVNLGKLEESRRPKNKEQKRKPSKKYIISDGPDELASRDSR